MINRISEITKRITEIQKGLTNVDNFKPEVVKDFEKMYQEAIAKTAEANTTKISKTNDIESSEIKVKNISNDKATLTEVKNISMNDQITNAVNKSSKKYNVSEELINAVIQTESNFQPDSVSKAGAMGLMQLMPGTALDMGVRKPFDIEENIDGGVRYLQMLTRRYDGDLDKVLSAYNAGLSRVDKSGGIPNIPETQNYVKKIKKLIK